MTTINVRSLHNIARDIVNDLNDQYTNQGKPNPDWVKYAMPYIVALNELDSIDDDYYADSAHSVVCYTLSNLSYWRGATAKTVKAELKAMIA